MCVVVCFYYVWIYELIGGLCVGLNINVVEGFDKFKICFIEVCIELFLGFIFVNFDLDVKFMEDWFLNVCVEFESWVFYFVDFKLVEWVEILENCNWKVLVENYFECYYCLLNYLIFVIGVVKFEIYDI